MRVSLLVLAACLAFVALTLVSGASSHARADSALESRVAGCTDIRPKGSEQFTCAQQKGWGKCSASWMHGFCMKTCGKCGGAKPKGGKPKGGQPASGGGGSLAELKINAPASRKAPLKSYGAGYKANKAKVWNAIRGTGLSQAKQRMLFAIAMLETNSFNPEDRDKKKTGDSTNYSAFNINRDMLTRSGVSLDGLNTWAGLGHTVAGLKKMLGQYGINGFLNYLRGGWTGWQDKKSYGCAAYRNGIASMVKMIDANPSLLTDDRRIDIDVDHV